MKCLIISSGNYHYNYGGGQIYVRNIVQRLIRENISITLLNAGYTGELSHRQNRVEIDDSEIDKITVNKDKVASGNEDGIKLLQDIIEKYKPDVIHAHALKAQAAEAANKQGIPCIVTAHHGGILCPAGALLNHRDEICKVRASHAECLPCVLRNIRTGAALYHALRHIPRRVYIGAGKALRRMPFIHFLTPLGTAAHSIERKISEWGTIARYAKLMIAPSIAIKNAMIRNGVDSEKVLILPHGIPLHGKVPLEPGLQERPVRFFYTGRINYNKGLHILLEAFAKLKGEAELHIIGEAVTKPEKKYMRRLTLAYSKNTIFWHGKVQYDGITNRIAQYDVMVHPAIYVEIFGLTIAEALDIGRPVIATRCGGPEMQIKDGENGLLVKTNDVQDLKNAMQYVLDNRDEIRNFIRKSNDVISIEEHTHQLIKIYESVAKKAVVDRC